MTSEAKPQTTIHVLYDEDADTAEAQCDRCGWQTHGTVLQVADVGRQHIIAHARLEPPQ